MKILLTSILPTDDYDIETEIATPIPMNNTNNLLDILNKNIEKRDRLVLIANDPENIEKMDTKINVIGSSFALSNLPFKEVMAIDIRNYKNAKDIILKSDAIILCGGKCIRQMKFFNKMGLKNILKEYSGLVIGISAGSMNLGDTIANFPEELADMGGEKWIKGLGFHNSIIIPHFDGECGKYQFVSPDGINIAEDYILPMSAEKELLAIPNYSYILIDNDNYTYYGNAYKLKNGKITKIN